MNGAYSKLCRVATVTCLHCGTLLAAEGDPQLASDAPCSACGRAGQSISVALIGEEMKITAGSVGVEIVEYSTILMREADSLLFHAKQPGLAIVVAHTACEVATQRAFARAFVHRGISDIEDAVDDLFASYNLASQKVQQFYTALTGDAVQREPWWSDFKDSSKRRNDIVHEGRKATDAEAATSLSVCDTFVTHITKYELPPRR
jgi:hypothetical protein